MEVMGPGDFGNAVTEVIKNAPGGTLLVERPMPPNDQLNMSCLNFRMHAFDIKGIWHSAMLSGAYIIFNIMCLMRLLVVRAKSSAPHLQGRSVTLCPNENWQRG